MKVLVAVVSLAVAVTARMPFVLPNSADLYLRGRSLDTSFSCSNRPYGYYADVDNECAIFHICQPVTSDAGELLETAHFSFICGDGTIFSQSSLTCAAPDLAYSCSDAPNIYDSSNSLFGTIDDDHHPIIFPVEYRGDNVVEDPAVVTVEVLDPIFVPVVVEDPDVVSVAVEDPDVVSVAVEDPDVVSVAVEDLDVEPVGVEVIEAFDEGL